MSSKVSIICALAAKNRAIGKNNALLWNIPADLKRFKELTTGHPIIMGQKTFESIGRPLPGRENIVITNDKNFNADNCKIFYSIPEAINYAKMIDPEEIFIIGGGSIYAQTIDMADRLYLTLVEGDFDADTYFPDYSAFEMISATPDESNGFNVRYCIYERK